MRILPNLIRAASLSLCLVVCCCRSSTEAPPRDEGAGRVHVVVRGIPSTEGQLLISVFLGPAGFPGEVSQAYASQESAITGTNMEFDFADVPAGPVAVAVLHDVDEDYELGTTFFGIPNEDWGVSGVNDGFFGPPSFKGASLRLVEGQSLQVFVTLAQVVEED